MNELLQVMLGQGIVGQVIKHIIPWDGVNKLIPLFNAIGGVAYAKTQGLDWASAATIGIVGQLGIENVKEKGKGLFGGDGATKFPGIGVRDKRIAFVKRSF